MCLTRCVAKLYINIINFLKFYLVNKVDQDLKKLADQDLHCFSSSLYIIRKLVENKLI